jgi:hypothetical protein
LRDANVSTFIDAIQGVARHAERPRRFAALSAGRFALDREKPVYALVVQLSHKRHK